MRLKKIVNTFICYLSLISFAYSQKSIDVIKISAFKEVLINLPKKHPCINLRVGMEDTYIITTILNPYLISIKAQPEINFPPTNLLILSNEAVYNAHLVLEHNIDKFLYFLNENDFISLLDQTSKKKSNDKDSVVKIKKAVKTKRIASLMYFEKDRCAEGVQKNKIIAYVNNIAMFDNKIYFSIKIINNSNIEYEVDNVMFFLDRKKKKKGVNSLVGNTKPLNVAFLNKTSTTTAKVKSKALLIYKTLKFSLTNGQKLKINIQEKEGNRNLELKISRFAFNDNLVPMPEYPLSK